jgi:serine/threonine protein kinase
LETHLKHIREEKKYVPEEMALNFFTQICLGLRELHKKNIIHRDLKLRNVLIFSGGIVGLLGQDHGLRDIQAAR